MGLQALVLMIASPSVVAFDFLGHGECMDSNQQQFERFKLVSLDTLYVAEASQCACPQCEDLCEATQECIGYSFLCCVNTQDRCIAGAEVLFSKGSRPEGVPAGFSTTGYRGSPTAGDEFPGEGRISSVRVHVQPQVSVSCYGSSSMAELV